MNIMHLGSTARAAGLPRQEKGGITQCLKPVPKEAVGGFGISFQFSSVLLSHFESSPFTIWGHPCFTFIKPSAF